MAEEDEEKVENKDEGYQETNEMVHGSKNRSYVRDRMRFSFKVVYW